MKKRLQGFAAGVAATLMLMGVFAVADEVYESISVIYNDIKIEIDGESFIATNVNGEIVEPFIYEGTTYLPVRAIATAFDKDVAWDEETYTVSLTSKKTDETQTGETDGKEENTLFKAEQFAGVWYANISGMLADLGVPETIMKDYDIYATYEFREDGTYSITMDEKEIDTLVDASFVYALSAYGITEEQYPVFAGVSVEETKAAIKAEIDLAELNETGTYGIDSDGMLVLSVDGHPQNCYEVSFEDSVMTLNGEVTLVLSKK